MPKKHCTSGYTNYTCTKIPFCNQFAILYKNGPQKLNASPELYYYFYNRGITTYFLTFYVELEPMSYDIDDIVYFET